MLFAGGGVETEFGTVAGDAGEEREERGVRLLVYVVFDNEGQERRRDLCGTRHPLP